MNNKTFGGLHKFYFEYNTKYKNELKNESMRIDHDDIINRISNILNFELEYYELFENVLKYLNIKFTNNVRE